MDRWRGRAHEESASEHYRGGIRAGPLHLPVLRSMDRAASGVTTDLKALPERDSLSLKLASRHRSPCLLDISTSIDHIHAVATGGDVNHPCNLATACYRCQQQKSSMSIESLGWKLQPPSEPGIWSGSISAYPELWQALGRPDLNYHCSWIKAFSAVA